MFIRNVHSKKRHFPHHNKTKPENQTPSPPEIASEALAVTPPIKPFPYLNLHHGLFLLISTFCNQQENHLMSLVLAGALYPHYHTHPPENKTQDSALTLQKQTSLFIFRCFKALLLEAELYNAVKMADYEKAKKLIDLNPTLMFKPVSHTDKEELSKRQSPLQYAFKVYDTYMWQMFYEKIKEDPQLKEIFFSQMLEQTEHLDLDAFTLAHTTFVQQWLSWLNSSITNAQYGAAWCVFGKAQMKYLPAYMVKEFAREGQTWSVNSDFDVNKRPPPQDSQIRDGSHHPNRWRSAASIMRDPNWGVSFALVRFGQGNNAHLFAANSLHGRSSWRTPTNDIQTFHRLLSVRKEEFSNQVCELFECFPDMAVPGKSIKPQGKI